MERKFKDIVTFSGTSSTGARIQQLCEIVQGTGEKERIGRKCTLKAIHWQGSVNLPSSAANTTDIVRIMVVQDTQANGAVFNPGDLLDGGDVFSFRNLENSQRFRVLSDKRYTLNSTGAANGNANENGAIQRYIKGNLKVNIPLEYSGTTGVITELRSNNVTVFAISEQGVATIDLHSRIRFIG